PEDDDFDMEEELQKLKAQRMPRQPEMGPRSRRALIGDPRVTIIPERGGHGDSEEDSDSDGPILYRDDDEEEEDEEEEEGPPMSWIHMHPCKYGGLMYNRWAGEPCEEKGHIGSEAGETREAGSRTKGSSGKPRGDELEQQRAVGGFEEQDRYHAHTARKILRFHEYVESTHAEDYDRRGDKPWTKLTAADKVRHSLAPQPPPALREALLGFNSRLLDRASVQEASKKRTCCFGSSSVQPHVMLLKTKYLFEILAKMF
ncbi:hypothetical protein XENOCAPTIV_022623, partial [Xenoophorus captivus]